MAETTTYAAKTETASAPCDLDKTQNGPFALYDRLIEGIPRDILVKDYCLGLAWSYVEADCGMGVGYTLNGGAKRTNKCDLRGKRLVEVAQLSKSWSWQEATLGIAALNAYYSQRERIIPLGACFDDDSDQSKSKMNAFSLYRNRIEATKDASVVVVGHFPHVENISEYARLTVLERNCVSDNDTPDPACEYVIPEADFLFMTGVTLTNKTAPRLLTLAHRATCIMLGPSVIMSPVLFDFGVETLAGSVVNDPEKTRFAVKNAAGQLFGESHHMCCLFKDDADIAQDLR